MTTARYIVTLLKSYIAGDEDRFLATAMQLAAHEARQGHGKLAQELKELIDAAKMKAPAMVGPSGPVPLGACLSNRRILLAKEARVRFCPWA
jgi:hypothetical protein